MVSCPVSVVIPTYNREAVLQRAILSVRNQTVACSEIIVIDDGSTDDSEKLLSDLAGESDIPIVVVKTENSGVAVARNRGILTAKNDFVAFLDSDDHWHKKKIETQYHALTKNPEYLISHTKEKWLRRGQHLNQKKIHIPRQGDIFDHCLKLCAVGMSTVMLKKSVFDHVGYFDESLQCCEDYDLWLRVSSRFPFLLIDERLTIKEGGREDQLSFIHRVGMDKLRIYSLKKLIDAGGLSKEQQQIALDELDKKIAIYAQGCMKHANIDEGKKYMQMQKEYKTKAESMESKR